MTNIWINKYLKHLSKKSLQSALIPFGYGGGDLELTICIRNANWLRYPHSAHGGLPDAISITVQPTDQISANLPWPLYWITSGAIQFGVPINERKSSFYINSDSRLLEPKSANLQIPLLSTRTLAPFMSLWMIPWECRYSRPSSIYLVYFLSSASLNFPYL